MVWPITAKSNMVVTAIMKNKKSLYVSNDLRGHQKIWHDDALWPSRPVKNLKFRRFWKPKMAAATIWKIEKSSYPSNGLTDHHKIWHGDTLWHTWPFQNLKYWHFENPRWRQCYLEEEGQHLLTGQHAAKFQATGQPVSGTQASDAMTSQLPRYEAKCVQCRCFQCGSVPLHSDIKETELPLYWYHSKGSWFRYNFAAESFYVMKLCSRLFVLHCWNCPKDDKFR